MKKLLAILLSATMILSLAVVPAQASEEKITLRMIDTLAAENRTAAIEKIIADY